MAANLVKQFFTGGKCFFTVKVPVAFASEHKTELHYTYRIEQAEPTERFPKPAHFVKLLTGPNNTEDYSYLGMLNAETGEVRLTAKSFARDTAWSVRIVRRVLAQVFEGEGVPAIQKAGWEVDHMGKCGRCGRPLTVPESLECGVGPDCAALMGIPYATRSKAKTPRKPRTPKCEKPTRAELITEEGAALSAAMASEAAAEEVRNPAPVEEPAEVKADDVFF